MLHKHPASGLRFEDVCVPVVLDCIAQYASSRCTLSEVSWGVRTVVLGLPKRPMTVTLCAFLGLQLRWEAQRAALLPALEVVRVQKFNRHDLPSHVGVRRRVEAMDRKRK